MSKTQLDLPCPHRAAEDLKKDPEDRLYTCHDLVGSDMSDVRSHVRQRHIPFCRLCKHCQDEVLDLSDFDNNHDKKCQSKKAKQRKGPEGQRLQWNILFQKFVQQMDRKLTLSYMLGCGC